MKVLPVLSLFALASVCACSFEAVEPDYQAPETQDTTVRTYNSSIDRILLQNPQTREVVECNSHTLMRTGVFSTEVENCARALEKQGFIRVSNIPQFTAKDDKITDNYPSRRFRDEDVTPRW